MMSINWKLQTTAKVWIYSSAKNWKTNSQTRMNQLKSMLSPWNATLFQMSSCQPLRGSQQSTNWSDQSQELFEIHTQTCVSDHWRFIQTHYHKLMWLLHVSNIWHVWMFKRRSCPITIENNINQTNIISLENQIFFTFLHVVKLNHTYACRYSQRFDVIWKLSTYSCLAYQNWYMDDLSSLQIAFKLS